MTDDETFRDVALTRETRDELDGLLKWLNVEYPPSPRHTALQEVIQRWDENEASEFTLRYERGR